MAIDNERELLELLQGVTDRRVTPAKTDPVVVTSKDGASPATMTVAAPPSQVTKENLWRHPDAHPVVLDFLLLKKYGPDWLRWEPETLQRLVPEDFKTQSLSELNLGKVQACRTLHLVDSYWQRWEVFLACTMPFNGEFPDFESMQVPTVAQVLVSCDIAHRIRDDMTWTPEMEAYVGAVYKHDDIYLPLPPADFALFDVPEAVDQAALKQRWPEVKVTGKAPTGATIQDEQLRRLLQVDDYLEESRLRLRQQMALEMP